MNDDIEKLKSAHEKTAEDLKNQVKEAMKEIERVRSASEEQVREHREEADALREKLAQWKAGAAADEQPQATKAPAPEKISEKVKVVEPETVGR